MGLLERLDAGEVVIGDGGFVFELEKRGYVKAGPWTPEVCLEHPEVVRGLHREFLRAGSDVMQTFTFYASDDKLCNRGNEAGVKFTCRQVNDAACRLAHEVAAEGDALVAGGISQTPSYLSGLGKKATQAEFKKQVDVFVENKVDFLIAEYFEHVEEMEWAIESLASSGLPVCATMCIGPEGDLHGVSAGQCAVRMARAGAHAVGVNCHFDPFVSLEAVRLMKEALAEAGLKAHLMAQPLAIWTPDTKKQGFIDQPEFPFALEPRIMTRWEIQKYARQAYELGVRYIGGCCMFQAYHIRAVAEELREERGKLPAAHQKHELWGGGLLLHTKPWVRARASREYWSRLSPATGRPYSAALSRPAGWGVTAGHQELLQHKEPTTQHELDAVNDKFKEAEA
ncbi:Betaine--homocysteine S-methyltransferase 1 [Amphibalanus amphitrite]|uniref:Betaine--homocysteine S-methyltransferase 1 n=1 Tax=Amphibalanus amphitrite TaxID=1232801 RepID=A0A6A4V577_AMPAM|nr:Betaine--homocysteine S-methyltransferase 1 [Amphibalanus amphitrite]